MINVLIIGSGGRYHAMAWKIRKFPKLNQLFIAPGNAGTGEWCENINIQVNDFVAIQSVCLREHIDLVVVGPEEPLVNGIYDYFQNDAALKHVALIGPSKEAAQLEGSKAYTKAFMQRHNIPTAAYREFEQTNYAEGVTYLKNHPPPNVLKGD